MNHNQPPENQALPEIDPPEWTLPISFAQTELLSRRLDAAGDIDTVVTTQDAQTIALCISDQLGSGVQSAIRQFAEIGSISAPALRTECLDVHAFGELTSGLRRWCAWLVIYAARALPPSAGGIDVPTNGDALDAYLRLPDVDPVDDEALEHFKIHYCGSYFDFDGVLDGMTDVVEWERKIHSLARDLGCEEFVSIDREAIGWHLREGWEVIPNHGRLHVFTR
ncbi:hypothetical protein [Mycobacterium sp. 236(2023)]|uniref:hypothetical protein n=1 Tax=Mycobacterium sp. 236(2023) TaxID=3038163 RepID=UPI002415414E|nr:hypothetical protein [Mycobacterium sp. 236(2023)]MDG4668667.1 hypothetical protein [Mycobacterium sp. 236(2023)]